MENSKINILIIEDNPSDAELVKLELKKSGFIRIDHFLNIETFRSLFVHGKYDVILCDYNLGTKLGIEILDDVRNSNRTIPFIFVSGAIGEERAVEVLRLGATDYVMKSNLGKLTLVITRALKEVVAKKQEELAQQKILESEKKYRSLIEHMNEALLFSDGNGKILFVNQQFCTMTGYSSEELIGAMGYDLLTPKTIREELKKKVSSREKGVSEVYDMEMLRKDGQIILVKNSASPIVEEGMFIGVMSMLSDITIEKKQESILKALNESLGVAVGGDYFSELTKFLADHFSIKLAMVGTYSDVDDSVETISFRINGTEVDNISYRLENTPCSNVVGKTVCVYPEKVQQLFPLDIDLVHLNAESYIGVPLFDKESNPSGLIVLIDDKPMKNVEEIMILLSVIGSRAGAELQQNIISKSLKESELKYRKVVEDQTELIFRWVPDGRIVFANKSFLNFNQLSEEEILTKNITDLVPPGEMERFRNKIEKLSINAPVLTDSHHAVHSVWGEFWHEWTDRAFFDEQENIIEYQSIGRDITQKRIAQLALAESEKKYKLLFSNNPNPMFVADMDTMEFLEVNEAALLFYGYSEMEFSKLNVFDIRPSYDKEKLRNHIKTLGNQIDRTATWQHMKKGGEIIDVEIISNVVEFKNRNARLVLVNDVTERNKAIEKLKETSRILELVNSLVVVVNNKLEVTYISPSVNHILGFTQEELLGERWWAKTISSSEDIAVEKLRVKEIFTNGITSNNIYYERLIKTKEGKQKWIGWEKSLSPDGFLIGVGQDITTKKLAELQLEESEKFKESILSALTASIAVITSEGEIVSVNNNWELFSKNNNGNPLCTDAGVNYLEVCKKSAGSGDKIAADVLEGITKVIVREKIKFEYEYPCNSETEIRWFHMIVTPFSGLAGGVVISHYDISEKKVQEQKIEIALRELKNIDRILDAVNSGYSLSSISELILNSFVEIQGEITGRVYFLDKKAKNLELKYELLKEGILSKIEEKLDLKIGMVIPDIAEETYFGKIIKENKYLFFDNKISIIEFIKAHTSNVILKKFADWTFDLIPIKAVGIIPLSIEGKVIGLITLTAPEKISSDTQKSLIRLAEQSTYAIAKKNAEDKLAERETYLSALIESIPDMLFRLNKDGIIIDYKSNDGGDGKVGQGGSLVGHNYIKLLPKNTAELHQQCVLEALRTGKSVSYDFEIQILGDKPKYYETRIKSNALNELVLIVRDVTIRKNQDQLLIEKESKLNEAQKIAKVGSWHLDIINNILEWSDESCRIFGVEPGTKLNLEKFLSYVHPLDRDYVNEEWAAAIEGKIYNIEHRIIIEGKTKWVREKASLEKNNEGVVIGGLGTVQDITSIKIAEEELINREELLSFSHKLAKIGYYTWNPNADVLWWSRELYELFEMDVKEVIPSDELFLKLLHPQDLIQTQDFFNTILQNPQPFTLDYRIITSNGIEKHLRETCEIEENENGEKVFIGVLQDITEVKDFENALVKREKQIKKTHKLNTQIIETADQFFYVYKIDEKEKNKSRVTFASPQVKDVFGISTEEFLNNQDLWRDSIHPEDMSRLQVDKNKFYLSKEPVTLEYRIKNRETGSYFWVEDYVRPLLDENGEVVELYGSVKNIDDRKKSEEELLQREKLLKEAQHIAKLGSWEWDLNTNKVVLNDELYQILEISPENYGGNLNDLLEFISPESIPRFKEAISNAYDNYKSEDVELQIVTAKGNERRLLLRGSEQREIKNHSIIARGTLLDITEIWKSHTALFETEEKFKKIFESITDVYYQADAKGICILVSPSCEAMFEYTQEELIGKPLVELYEFPEKRKEILALLEKDGFLGNIENSVITKSGSRIYVSGSISILYDKDGKQIGVQGVVRNISEKKLHEIEREKLLLELTNKYNQLMQFNYIVSHNLRSPITNLLGLSNMFEGEMSENERIKIVTHIKNSALAMDGLVKDLNMILATRTAITENKEEVKLTQIFETIKNNLRTQIQESEAILISDIAEDNNKLFTIKSYLQSILYNLVSNALKYCSNERTPVIIIACEKNELNTIIQIRDNGSGMDLEKYGKQLFGLYKRFDLSKEGRGLGLHMTKTQIEALGGEVKVESELGKGTTFTIILPN